MSEIKKCPYCASPQKRPTKIEYEYGVPREYPTEYKCGTVTSPNWDSPLRYCGEGKEKEVENETMQKASTEGG